jgi:hypothetical protein
MTCYTLPVTCFLEERLPPSSPPFFFDPEDSFLSPCVQVHFCHFSPSPLFAAVSRVLFALRVLRRSALRVLFVFWSLLVFLFSSGLFLRRSSLLFSFPCFPLSLFRRRRGRRRREITREGSALGFRSPRKGKGGHERLILKPFPTPERIKRVGCDHPFSSFPFFRRKGPREKRAREEKKRCEIPF